MSTYLAMALRIVHADPTHANLESLLVIADQVEALEVEMDLIVKSATVDELIGRWACAS